MIEVVTMIPGMLTCNWIGWSIVFTNDGPMLWRVRP